MLQEPEKSLEWEKEQLFSSNDPGTASLLVTANASLAISPNMADTVSFAKLIFKDLLLHKINYYDL